MVAYALEISSPAFPNELFDKIVGLLLAGDTNGYSKRKFAVIASFTLASKRLREIALRRFFSSLRPHDSHQWTQLYRLMVSQGEKAFRWVRQVHADAVILSYNPTQLHSLPNLQTLVVDFSQSGAATQQTFLRKIVKLPQPYLLNPPSPIGSPMHAPKAFFLMTSLILTALSFVDKVLLMTVAKNFPNLTYLHLSCTDRLDMNCCWGCFQESASCAIGISPIPDMFADVDHLANTYSTALKPLEKLTHLHLGIFLSNDDLLNSHFGHVYRLVDPARDTDDSVLPFGPDSCVLCRTPETIRMVRDCELAATKIMAKRLKSLRSIGWSTVFRSDQNLQPESDNEVGDPGRSTTRWVVRKDGKLYLRKNP